MTNTDGFRSGYADYVTFTVGEQLFGVPVLEVQDVFKPQAITRVPLAPAEIAGVLNLRGRIVTAIDVRARRLGSLGVNTVPWSWIIDTRSMEMLEGGAGAPADMAKYARAGLTFVNENPHSY